MAKLEITYIGRFTGDSASEEEIDAALDRVQEALLDTEAIDPSMSGSLATGVTEITLTLEGPDEGYILKRAGTIVAEALERAGVESFGKPRPSSAFHFEIDKRELVTA